MTINELNDLVIKESTKLTEDNWFTEIVQVIESILRDHQMIPYDMILRWSKAKNANTRDRENVILYLPETTDAFSLFSVLTYKLNLDAPFGPKYAVNVSAFVAYLLEEHQSIQAIIDKAVIALYTAKTDREVREYESRENY